MGLLDRVRGTVDRVKQAYHEGGEQAAQERAREDASNEEHNINRGRFAGRMASNIAAGRLSLVKKQYQEYRDAKDKVERTHIKAELERLETERLRAKLVKERRSINKTYETKPAKSTGTHHAHGMASPFGLGTSYHKPGLHNNPISDYLGASFQDHEFRPATSKTVGGSSFNPMAYGGKTDKSFKPGMRSSFDPMKYKG
jgi:hypothetical protein